MLLRYGSSGSRVRDLQGRLGVAQDGIYGNQTRNALSNWQRNNGLVADGVFGQASYARMYGGSGGGGYRTTPVTLRSVSNGGRLNSSSSGPPAPSLTPGEMANFTMQEQRSREANRATLDRLDFSKNSLQSRRILDEAQVGFTNQTNRERLLNTMAARGLYGSGIEADQRDKMERSILMDRGRRDQTYNSQLQEFELSRTEAARALELLLSQIEGQRQAQLATRRAQLQGSF